MNITKRIGHRGSSEGLFILIIIIVIVAGLGILFAVWPHYKVYQQRLAGEAMLAHAQSSKEVAVAEAKAKMESAKMLADAEVMRAEGVARANKVIGDSLKGNESYLRYLWIQGIESNNPTVIYVPVEANLPILESTRLNKLDPPRPPEASSVE